ncbi:MAG: hypothetical protein JO197_03435 [Acidobacteria bacterium]|nr:hypothetical protein [Acidobacteriota bacterium]MBV9476564.1 hypothetical protein [Acidobacteriota bacterium]
MLRTVSLLFALLLGPTLAAQGPSADWRTIETPHFRVHYPKPFEAWARAAAERLESIRDAVSREVGYAPRQVVDVIVTNPEASPNGEAWPLLDTPRMIFFAEPPGPDEQLGAYGSWIEILAVHETAHIVHMLRPSRNPFERFLEHAALPVDPIVLHAPRWVLEGYATVVEGRLTGAGRPSSTLRALILRRWAEGGRLPSYAQLNSDQRFLGMSMAYLMGSAFLEWLEQRGGPDSLRHLWARMTARERRSFDSAFAGVFGDRPDRLYGRFVAELTASAIAIDRASTLVEGTLWQETSRATGDPAVSPDGKELAIVLRPKEGPQQLVVWSTAAPDEEEEKFAKRLRTILASDPEDVAPVRTKPLPRKAVHTLTMPDGGDIVSPRWTRDGKSLVFAHRVRDPRGALRFDLYRWDFDTLTRVTHLADVREADPLANGTAVAIRSRFGAVQLVNVDLATGAVTPRTEPSIDVIVSHPRVSPGGKVAWVEHRGGRWTLVVDGAPIALSGDVASPEWIDDDALVVTVSNGGFAELHRVTRAGDDRVLTRARGGAFDPAPMPPSAGDGRVFFMSLDPDGYVVRALPATTNAAPAPPAYDALLVPAVPPAPPRVTSFATRPVSAPRAYGIGRQELGWFVGQDVAPRQRATQLGVRLGDVVGRLDTIAVVALGTSDAGDNDEPRGAALVTAWRGWPIEIRAHFFETNRKDGVEVRGIWTRGGPRSRLTLEGGALSREFAFASASLVTQQVRGLLRLEESERVDVDENHVRAIAGVAVRRGAMRVAARYQHDSGDLTVGGLSYSVYPRSVSAHRIIDPALTLATLIGNGYDGWRIESTVPLLPFTAFYQRHELGATRLSLAGLEWTFASDPLPILKVPGLDLTLGAARVLDAPLRGHTNWWIGMRWRP